MELTRRQFGKLTGAAAAGVAFSGLGSDLKPVAAYARELKTKGAKETTTICPYCAVGCGAIVSTSQKDGRIINIEGDPDHVINRGALCPKGASLLPAGGQQAAADRAHVPGALRHGVEEGVVGVGDC